MLLPAAPLPCVPHRLLGLAKQMHVSHVRSGDAIYRAGDLCDGIFVLLEGHAEAFQHVVIRRRNRWPVSPRAVRQPHGGAPLGEATVDEHVEVRVREIAAGGIFGEVRRREAAAAA